MELVHGMQQVGNLLPQTNPPPRPMGLVGIMAQPHQLAAVGTGKDEHACRVGMAAGNFIKRFCTIGWALVGGMTNTPAVRQALLVFQAAGGL